jgi:hypothetical protein
MPTGYTAGIIDGKIKTFPEFAKLCMRAFGATIHMRDDSMEAEFVPREPSKYYTEQIEKANQQLKQARELSDKEIVSLRKSQLEESKKYHLESIERAKESRKALSEILMEAENYEPPTGNHIGIKEFMIQQVKDTIAQDCNTSYHDNNLEKIANELLSLNPAVIRFQMIADAEKNISYHKKESAEEVKRCNDSNKWVEDFLTSIK